jgi:hypothetical protein
MVHRRFIYRIGSMFAGLFAAVVLPTIIRTHSFQPLLDLLTRTLMSSGVLGSDSRSPVAFAHATLTDRPGLTFGPIHSTTAFTYLWHVISHAMPLVLSACVVHAGLIISSALLWKWRSRHLHPMPFRASDAIHAIIPSFRSSLTVGIVWPLTPYLIWSFWQSAFYTSKLAHPSDPPGTPWIASMYSEVPIWVGTPVIVLIFLSWLVIVAFVHHRQAASRLNTLLVERLLDSSSCVRCGYPIGTLHTCPECGRSESRSLDHKEPTAHAPEEGATTRRRSILFISSFTVLVATSVTLPRWSGQILKAWIVANPEIPSGWTPWSSTIPAGRAFLRWVADADRVPAPLWR